MNRLSGRIPGFLGDIVTLKYLYVVTLSCGRHSFQFWEALQSFFRFAPTVILKEIEISGVWRPTCFLELFPPSLGNLSTWRIC